MDASPAPAVRPRTPQPLPAPPRLASLSAFLPVHDERGNLRPQVAALLAILPRVARRWELVLVDDGSRDGSAALIDAVVREHPGTVRVVRHATNRGYGAALRSGFAAARFGHVFFTDADRQFDVAELPMLLEAIAEADVVVGYRARRADPAHRRALATLWNLAVRVGLGVPLRDVNCAFKLFRRDAIEGVVLDADGAAASAELMAAVFARGARVVEVAVSHRPRPAGMPSGGRPAVALRALRELWRLRRRLAAPPHGGSARVARRAG